MINFIESPGQTMSGQLSGKRVFDVAIAAVLMITLLPLIATVALLVRLTSEGPIIFRQTRIGLHEQQFELLKFRTMFVNNDASAHERFIAAQLTGEDTAAADGVFKLLNDPRVTPVGRFLRRFSLDELPQLWNVFVGTMSLVGPRPAMPWEVELFTDAQRIRSDARPGLTGLWQVSGRNLIDTAEMLEIDQHYVQRLTWRRELMIILRTPLVMVRGDGAR